MGCPLVWFLKNSSIGSPSQTTFRLLFIYFFLGGGGGGVTRVGGGGCKKDWVRRKNRQDFPYPKEIFLAL